MTKMAGIAAIVLVGGYVSSTSAADTVLVSHADSWRYHRGSNAPVANWKTTADASLDATWLTGNGSFGYADNATETNGFLTLIPDMLNSYRTFYIRKTFSVTNTVDPESHLKLSMDFDDGFIAWLDGTYLTNRFVTGAPNEPANTAGANASHESSHGNSSPSPVETYDFGPVGSRLTTGTHVFAIIGLNQTLGSSDFILVPDLSFGTPPQPATNTWYASNSPIVILTNVTVTSASMLIVEPGTTVQFGAGISLNVANGGTLLAEGTSNAPILFTRNGVSTWGHIVVNGAVGSPESRISYARFEFNNVSPCIQVSGGTVFLDHLTFGNTAQSYLHVDDASFVVQNCEFPSATAGFELVHGTGGIKSGGHGIFSRNFFGAATGYNDVVDFTGGNRPGPIVQFFDNVFVGSGDDELDLDGTDAWVEGNIFLHAHKNGSPDTSSGVSGGDDSGDTSEITVVGNLFYDCDQATMGKGGNFYTILNNTIVHQTRTGGTDTDGGVFCLADEGFAQCAGMFIEANIVYDAEKLTRFYTNSAVTMSNNLMPFSWSGAGGNNSTTDPLLTHVPLLSETTNFTNWASAQILKQWFKPQTNSPAIGAGINGVDRGGAVPIGSSISGEPSASTTNTSATLAVGFNRRGSSIPTASWPLGSGYTNYKYRLDGGVWSAPLPLGSPIVLSNLSQGAHYVEVSGQRDTGLYQDDPLLGPASVVSRSKTWVIGASDTDGDGIPDDWEMAHGLNKLVNDAGEDPDHDGMTNLQEYLADTNPTNAMSRLALTFTPPASGLFRIQFDAVSNKNYSLYSRPSFATGNWVQVQSFPAVTTNRSITVTNNLSEPTRFYEVTTP